MTFVTAEQVRAFLLEYYSDFLEAAGFAGSEVPDGFDLLLEGVIDSLGVVEMVTAVSEHFGLSIDLTDLAPEDLTRIGPFTRFVAKYGKPLS